LWDTLADIAERDPDLIRRRAARLALTHATMNFPRFPGDSAIWIRRLRVGG